MLTYFVSLSLLLSLAAGQASDDELRAVSEEIWAADTNRIVGADVVYDINGAQLFTYVNEARLTGTYAAMLALYDYYTEDTAVAETCDAACQADQNAFLDAILATQPIQILHSWLVGQGLAAADVAAFKEELRQYWFLPYSRHSPVLGSSGFEHIFLGEIDENVAKGLHNWVRHYFEEKNGNLIYGPHLNTCPPEDLLFGFTWLGHNKPVSGFWVRTSPEVEIALGTLCLLARMGPSCPISVGGTQTTMTVWDMTGYPTTIGSSYPNCEPATAVTDDEIRAVSEEIWAADANRIDGADVIYDINAAKLFTYVNEARLTGTYAALLALYDYYTEDTAVAETCDSLCQADQNAFLDAILATQPIKILHSWLVGQGLASADVATFKEELRQYWFLPYSRHSGVLGSSGFEHIFLGEMDEGAAKGLHNWVFHYFEEKSGDLVYGPYISTCVPENIKYGFTWMGSTKPISGCWVRTSPEVEIALGTLCLLARMGPNCPISLDGTQTTMTVWDMTGYPLTIGSCYPNC